MAKSELKGKIEAVGPVSQVGDNNTDKQFLILHVAGYHDGFEQVGRDQQWCLQILGKKVKEFNFSETFVDKKMKAVIYLDSQFVEYKEPAANGDTGFYPINATLASFEIVP